MKDTFKPLPQYEQEYLFDSTNEVLYSIARKSILKGTIRTCRGVTEPYYTLVKAGVRKQVSLTYIKELNTPLKTTKTKIFNVTKKNHPDQLERSYYLNEIDMHNDNVKRKIVNVKPITMGKTTRKSDTKVKPLIKLKLSPIKKGV